MRVTGTTLYVALLGVLSLTQSALASNEAFGSLMLFLYNAYRFDEFATDGKPGLANKCKPEDGDGASSSVNKGCNFHGFLRHVLNSDYDPSKDGKNRVSDPWMPTEGEVADLQKWKGVDADAGYDAGKVMGSSGNYFSSHLVFRVVAARVKKLAKDHKDAAKGAYGGMLDSVDRIQFAMRADGAGKFIKTVQGLLGDNKGKLKTADVQGLYGVPGYKQVDLQATSAALSGDALDSFRDDIRGEASKKLEKDKDMGFRDVVLLRDELNVEVNGGDICSGRNRDGDKRDDNDKKDKDDENQSCKIKGKRGFLEQVGDALFRRQKGGSGGKNCVTKTETKYVTQGHHYYTPHVSCDPDEHTQACYHYRSVMSVHKGTESMTAFTCRDGTAMDQDGSATDEWGSTAKPFLGRKPAGYAQHNYAWTSGLPPDCERDEYPPRYFWPVASKDTKGKEAQRVRFVPRADNGGAGQLWKGFCSETGSYGPMIKTGGRKKKVVPNSDLYQNAAPAVTNNHLGKDGTMTEVTTSYVRTPRAVWSMQFDDSKFNLPNDGLDDNACLPDIVRGTDPGWALLTYDEFYDRNPHLQMYTALYKDTNPPNALPAQPAPQQPPAPAPPRRLRRGTRGEWEEAEERGRCFGLKDPSEVVGNVDVEPTEVPADEGEEIVPEAESRQSASPELPVPTGA